MRQQPYVKIKLLLLGLLTAACLFLIIWFHHVRKSDVVFTHFFYLPVVLAALWWGYRGVWLAAGLSAALLVSRLLSSLEVTLWVDLVRSVSLLLVGIVVAELSRRRSLLEDDLIRQSNELENKVKERTRQLHEKNRELEAYAHTVSHDLMAPLVVIEGYVELLREKGGDSLGEEEKEYLLRIEKAAERMRRMTKSLLEYARAGTASGEEAADAGAVLREVLAERSLDIERGGVRVEIAEDMPRVGANPDRLHQVFANLLDNALKYMGDGQRPHIVVGWRPEGRMACFFFRDNGIGIDEGCLEEVFQPFRRLSNRGEPGLGIGLSTVRRLVEAWGGRVWAESSPGEGSTFYFTVPLCDLASGEE